MAFQNEHELEAHIRALIRDRVTQIDSSIYALQNKKAVDILVCKDGPSPELFFIEVKFHKPSHGRLGTGGGAGGGFQPEILREKPAYFKRNLRWALASERHQIGKLLLLTSATVRKYLTGGKVDKKYNNINVEVFHKEPGLNKDEFVRELLLWFGAKDAQPVVAPDAPQAAPR